MTKPIELMVVCPSLDEPCRVSDFEHGGGYRLSIGLLSLPVPPVMFADTPATIGRALESDGYSPFVNFALLNAQGDTLYCGRVGGEPPDKGEAHA